MLNLSETEKAWLACAIDGEGTIVFQPKKRQDTQSGGGRTYIAIYNTNLSFVKRALDITQTGQIKFQPPKGKLGRKPYFYWMVGTRKACYEILKQILPYLIIKQQEAGQIILFHEIRKYSNKPYNKAELAILRGKYQIPLKVNKN